MPRHSTQSLECQRCFESLESCDHAIFSCPKAAHVWFASQLGLTAQLRGKSFSMFALLKNMHRKIKNDKKVLNDTFSCLFATAYFIWLNRNEVIFRASNPYRNPAQILAKSLASITAPHPTTITPRHPHIEPTFISKTRPPYIIIVDASFNVADHSSGIGFLIFDWHGNLILAGRKGSCSLNSEAAEMAALRWAFEEACRSNLHPFILCSNSLGVVQYLNNEATSVGVDQQTILGEVKSQVQLLHIGSRSVFCEVDMAFVVGAHELANAARMDPNLIL